MGLKPDQTFDRIFRGEAWYRLGFVLTDAANKIIGNSEIQCSMPPTGKEIDAIRHPGSPKLFGGDCTPLPPTTVIPGRPAEAGPGTHEHGLSVTYREGLAPMAEAGVHGFRARGRAAPRNDGTCKKFDPNGHALGNST